MPPSNDLNENTLLLSSFPTNSINFNPPPPSLFQKLRNNPLQTLKKASLVGVSAFSGYMYWPSSFSAAASVHNSLKYPAALGGSITNSIFNYESFLSLAELPNFRNMPWKYTTATLFAIACVVPNFFMNIYDDAKQEYVDNTQMALQAGTAFLNIWVNIVGTLELIDNLSSLVKNKTAREKEQLLAKLEQAIVAASHVSPEQQQTYLLDLLENNNILNLRQKITFWSFIAGISLLSVPQYVAYVLVSYFGTKTTANALNANEATSIALGLVAAIGNGIPGAGFTIKGVNSTSEKLMSLKCPSPLLAALFILPALLSGFTTHKAMADSLKELEYSGSMVELLNWSSNLGAALIYNLPQMLALANRLGKDTVIVSENLIQLQQTIKNKIQGMDSVTLRFCP